MKKTIFKILSLALTVGLLASLIVGTVPAGAISISDAEASPNGISQPSDVTLEITGAANIAAGYVSSVAVTSGGTGYGSAPTVTFESSPSGDDAEGVAVITGGVVTSVIVTYPGSGYTSAPDVTFGSGAATAVSSIRTDDITVVFPTVFDVTGANTFDFFNGTGGFMLDGDIDDTAQAAGILVCELDPADIDGATTGTWTLVIHDVVNPDMPGDYTVSVYTSRESVSVESTITISSPGIITYYNESGVYLGTEANIYDLPTLDDGWTVKIGSGVYLTNLPPIDVNPWNIGADDVTITSEAMPCIVVGFIEIDGDGCTLSNFIKSGAGIVVDDGVGTTLENITFSKTDNVMLGKAPPASFSETMLELTNDGGATTVTGCVFDLTSPAGYQDYGIVVDESWDVTIEDCVFKLDQTAAYWADFGIFSYAVDGLVITDNTFTGNSGNGVYDYDSYYENSLEISNNTFTGLEHALMLNYDRGEVFGNTIVGSTVNNDDYGAAVEISWPFELRVYNNNIMDSEGYALLFNGDCHIGWVTGNNIVNSNTSDDDVDAAVGIDSADEVHVELNFWDGGQILNPWDEADDIFTEPALTVANESAYAYFGWTYDNGYVANSPADSRDAGFAVRNYDFFWSDSTPGENYGWVVGQTLSGNPQDAEPPFPAIAYFDIYMSDPAIDQAAQINLYADGLTDASNIYYWSGDMDGWVRCSDQGVSGSGSYAWFKVAEPGTPNLLSDQTTPAPEEMVGTSFVIVDGIAPQTETIVPSGPEAGATTSLCNIPFSWPTVPGATGYKVVIWTTDMNSPVVEESVSSPSFMSGCLDAGSYFWKVFAMQGDDILSESAVGSFIAEAPPSTETTPPITITSQPPASITITQPPQTTVTIELPPEQPITPAWIYVIIGIGAVLVIVVIVLIVRTRRTT